MPLETETPAAGTRLRAALFAVVAGALFAAMRAPPGLSWTEVQAPRGWTIAAFGAAPWLALAVLLHPGRRAFRRGVSVPGMMLCGLLGFLVWSAWITVRFRPESRLGFALLLVVASTAMWALAGRKGAAEPAESPENGGPRDPWFARAGLGLAAAGAFLALGNLGQHVRLFGLGLPEERALASAVLLALVLLGTISFGGLFSRPGLERVLLGLGLLVAAAATTFGLAFLQKMDGDALHSYVKRFGLDLSMIGTLPATALLAAAAFVLPGLFLGAALRGARDPRRLSDVALGGAAGACLSTFAPGLLSGGPKALGVATWSSSVALASVAAAAVGALLFLGAERGRARILGWALALLVAALPVIRPRVAFTRFSPWYPAPIDPDFVLPTPQGILTVEPYVDGSRIVTLDRKRLTPILAEGRVDELRILRALGVMRRVEGRAPRLLLLGQLTPARSEFLKVLGPFEVEYTAPWFSAFRAIEDVLFPLDLPPLGTPISPAEAESRIASGRYDLVLVLPVHGPAIMPKSQAWIPWGSVEEPVLGSLDVPAGTTAVAWLDANSPLVRCALGERVLYVAEHFLRPTLGIVRGSIREDEAPERPAILAGGDPEPRIETWELLSILPRERMFPLQASLFHRLDHANTDGPEGALARGLAVHFGAQGVSSPFESTSQQIEFDEAEVRAFYSAGEAKPLDATTRDVLEDTAWLLTEKRRPDLVLSYMEGLVETHGPWIELERALARAFEELLEPGDALRYYDRILESDTRTGTYDLAEYLRAADLAIVLGDPARAIEYARKGLAIQPQKDLEMRLCKALLMFGDPAGDELLERLRPGLSEEDLAWIQGTVGPSPVEGEPGDGEADEGG